MGPDLLTTMFETECHQAVWHDMAIVEGIEEVGLCEHHLLPVLMIDNDRLCARPKNIGTFRAGAYREIFFALLPKSGADGSFDRGIPEGDRPAARYRSVD